MAADEGEAFPVLTAERDIGCEPTTFSLGSGGASTAGSVSSSQPFATLTHGKGGRVQPFLSSGPGSTKGFVTPLLQGQRGRIGRLRFVPIEAEQLLTVRDVGGGWVLVFLVLAGK